MKKLKINVTSIIVFILLIGIIFIGFYSRMSTKSELVADYDPWYFYRIAETILNNNMKIPKWDLLSYFPPGRPYPTSLGWEYTIIIFYKILSIFTDITFMKTAIISPAIMVALSVIPAFLLGKELSNEWGGLATAIFAIMAPTFIGVSMGSYLDTDVVVVFYSFLSIFSIFLAMKKKAIPYMVFAVIANMLFIFNWWFGWYVSFFFLLFIPTIFVFRIFEHFIRRGSLPKLKTIWNDLKGLFLPLIIIIVVTNIIMYLLGYGHVIGFVLAALGFRLGAAQSLLVNVSVAELQPINILTKGGFKSVAERVGTTPIYLMLFGLPALVIYKLFKREQIGFEEIFLFMWGAITFYTILNGVRFSLLFSIAVSTAAGYVIGNLIKYSSDKDLILKSSVFGILAFMVLGFVSQTLAFALNTSGMGISQNWVDMLDWLKENADEKAIIATWWDPGHIIAGYTGLRVHADGAHCGTTECYPFNHNIRIQDMGRIMSTSDEDEAINLLKKYMQLTPEGCQIAKNRWGDRIPKEGCEPASEMYFIASSDLIGKYTWMNYFGGYRAPIASVADFQKNPGVCCASTPKTEIGQMSCGEFANQGRGVWVWCPWIFSISDIQQDREGNNIYIYDYGGLKLSIVQKPNMLIPVYNNKYVITKMMFYTQEGQSQLIDLTTHNTTLEKIEGLIWIQPDFRSLIYFSPEVANSIFVRTFFFNGQGLEHFKLVYSNPEIRLYKVSFD